MSFAVYLIVLHYSSTPAHYWSFLTLMSYKYMLITLPQMALYSISSERAPMCMCATPTISVQTSTLSKWISVEKMCSYHKWNAHTQAHKIAHIQTLTDWQTHARTLAATNVRVHVHGPTRIQAHPLTFCAPFSQPHTFAFAWRREEKKKRQQVDRDEPFRICSFSFLLCVANRTE